MACEISYKTLFFLLIFIVYEGKHKEIKLLSRNYHSMRK